MQRLLANPENLRLPLFLLAGACLLLAAHLYLRRRTRRQRTQLAGRDGTPRFLSFTPSPVAGSFLRGLLLALAAVVALGFTLLILPQSAFDALVGGLSARTAPPPASEKIAFLYLGDAVKGKDLHIRGAIRNITTKPLDGVDAAVRLFAPDRSLLETTVVRLDAQSIPPDAVANFHLTYPDYSGQFGSYSVEFKFRTGEAIPYKDLRGVRPRE